MKLTEQQLFDYIHCPTKYHIKYVMKINLIEKPTMQHHLDTITRYFFLNLLNGKVCTYNDIKKKWDSICEKHNFDANKCLNGWGLIMKLLQWAERERICIGDVGANYMIPVGTHQLHGTINTILVKPSKQIELLTTSFSEKNLDKTEIDMKLKYTMDALGFKTLYGVEPTGIKIHSVKYDQDVFTNRTEPDIIRLKDTITNVANSIEQGIYYPRESAFCSTCNAKQYCRYWHK